MRNLPFQNNNSATSKSNFRKKLKYVTKHIQNISIITVLWGFNAIITIF